MINNNINKNPFCVQVSRLVLLAGGNPNVRTEFVNNAPLLCVAAREGFSDMVALLLEFGADVNATSDTGMSPLCYAAASGHREVMRMLCVRNSRVSIFLILDESLRQVTVRSCACCAHETPG